MQVKGFVRVGLIIVLSIVFGQGLWVSAAQSEAAYDYINISEPFLKKIPVAVPAFKMLSEASEKTETADKAADILSDGLEFTGYFKLIDRGAFLENPRETGITSADLDFNNWTDVGAELLITGGLRVNDDTVRLEIRLFDTFKGNLLFGKRYGGSIDDLRLMIHRFCDEMVYRLTGKKGLFGSRIVFINKADGKNAIYTCDFDGHNPTRIIESKAITLFPAWSPDGRAIAYTSYDGGNPSILIREIDGGQTRRIAHEGINITPTWLPGGDGLAATLSVNGDEEIYLLTESGKIDKRLTDSWGIDVSPTFSPDGKYMAFVSKRAGTPQIYIKNLDTDEIRRVTYEGNYNTEPDWSPEGDRIVYSAMSGGQADICVIGTDGGGLKQLTHDAGSNESPAWSPDGTLIVFSSTRSGTAKLYVMTASGTDQRPLLNMGGEQLLPDWSPAMAIE